MKKSIALYLFPLILLYLSSCAGNKTVPIDSPDLGETYIRFSSGKIKTLDPGVCYESAGFSSLGNMYETLLRIDPIDHKKFIPLLSTSVPRIDNGGISPDGRTYRFLIRKNVTFHNGDLLTPEDVEYSLERNLLLDPSGGPMWMLLEAIIGESSIREDNGFSKIGVFDQILKAIETKEGYVVIHLKKPYAPFLTILTQPMASIMSKRWAIENGCWDGLLQTASKFNNPKEGKESLKVKVNGTGPFKLTEFRPGKILKMTCFDGYWGQKALEKNITIQCSRESSEQKRALLKNRADSISLGYNDLLKFKERSQFDIVKKEHLHLDVLLFCQKMDADSSQYLGSKMLDGKGIPHDFFSDIHIRKAFLHAFDRDTYQREVLKDMGVIPTSPIVKGVPYAVTAPIYAYDLEKSKAYFMKAFDGQVWEKGFTLSIFYNRKNEVRQKAAENLSKNIRSLHPDFNISVKSLPWREYLFAFRKKGLPVFISGWAADYPDPHNFVYPLMKNNGSYATSISFFSKEVDDLIEKGVIALNEDDRSDAYEKLQHVWYDEAMGLPLLQRYTYYLYQKGISGVFQPLNGYGPSEFYGSLSKNHPVP